ncbi:MAG: alpha-L-fucosidase, partial [Ekhidna sp.]|nr:alpha-L-fucosidase [Ekhidna sp.]
MINSIVQLIIRFAISVGFAMLFHFSTAQNSRLIQVDSAGYSGRMEWWQDAKFGMFIHFGLYSEIGYNEWAIEHFNIPFSKYDEIRKGFNPSKFNAAEWTELAKDAGMKYMVVTTKHHDGFCLFDSKYTDWNISKTPFRRDLIGELSRQAKKDGIVFGTYYSMLDWHHPEYIPSRSYWDQSLVNPSPDSSAYFTYVQNQVKELQDSYDPQLIWFDWQKDMRDIPGLNQFWKDMLGRNPSLIINNRLAYTGKMGGYLTPENYIPANGFQDKEGRNVPFEVCYTMDRSSWGYNPYGNDILSTRDIIRRLCHVVSKGGNFLLNVGPKPDGTIQNEFVG